MVFYDVIGDIHGHSDELEVLLQKLGFVKVNGVYSHPGGRKVVFVGDFIDRGPKIRETLYLVRDMVLSGNAQAVMGNHEYNAVCFHTPNLVTVVITENIIIRKLTNTLTHLSSLKTFLQNGKCFWIGFVIYLCFLSWIHLRWCMRIGTTNISIG